MLRSPIDTVLQLIVYRYFRSAPAPRRPPQTVSTATIMDQQAVQLSRPVSFTTSGHTLKQQSLRPWSSASELGTVGGRGSTNSRARAGQLRRHREQHLSAARTEVLQAYLAEQLTHLSGPARVSFESAFGSDSTSSTERATQSPAAQVSPTRRKRHSPSQRRAASSVTPHHVVPTNSNGNKTSQASADGPKHSSGGLVSHTDAERGLGVTTPSFPHMIDRWPAHSSAPRPDDLGALRAPLSPPAPLVVDDGMLFEDHSRQAHSPTRARVRSSGYTDVDDLAKRASAAGPASAARSAMSGQLLRTAPKLLQDLEYYLNRELEENDVAGSERVGHPVRVRIIGDCFDCFIEHCSTYKPLLANIKYEYEETIALLRRQVDSARPKLNKLATLEQMTASEKVEQRVAHYQDTKGLRAENEDLKARTWRLEKEVAQLKEEMAKKNKRMEKYAGTRAHIQVHTLMSLSGQQHVQSDWCSPMLAQRTQRQTSTRTKH